MHHMTKFFKFIQKSSIIHHTNVRHDGTSMRRDGTFNTQVDVSRLNTQHTTARVPAERPAQNDTCRCDAEAERPAHNDAAPLRKPI